MAGIPEAWRSGGSCHGVSAVRFPCGRRADGQQVSECPCKGWEGSEESASTTACSQQVAEASKEALAKAASLRRPSTRSASVATVPLLFSASSCSLYCMAEKQTRPSAEPNVSKRGRAPRNAPPAPPPVDTLPQPPSRGGDQSPQR